MKTENLKVRERKEHEKKDEQLITLKLGGDGYSIQITGPAEYLEDYKKHDLLDLELRISQTKL